MRDARELLLFVLFFLVSIGFGGWVFSEFVKESGKADQALDLVATVQERASNTSRAGTDPRLNSNLMSLVAETGYVSLSGTGKYINAWGGTVTAVSIKDGFIVTHQGVPSNYCASMVATAMGNSRAGRNITAVSVDGALLGLGSQSITRTDAQRACDISSRDHQAITWIFSNDLDAPLGRKAIMSALEGH